MISFLGDYSHDHRLKNFLPQDFIIDLEFLAGFYSRDQHLLGQLHFHTQRVKNCVHVVSTSHVIYR